MGGLNAYINTDNYGSECPEHSAFESSSVSYTADFDAEHSTFEEVRFNDLYAEYGDYVYNVIRRVVGLEDAEDISQQTWIKVWRGGATFRGEAKISSWLFRVAQNTAFSHLRARGARIQPEALEDDPCIYANCEHPDTVSYTHLRAHETP